MNKFLLALLFNCTILFSQTTPGIIGQDNWLYGWTNFKPKNSEYSSCNKILTGKISQNLKLFKKNTYKIIGIVRVTNNSVLTIEPGTILRGDKESVGTIIIEKGAKIIAEGTESDPIVFTSNKNESEMRAGDWGGLIILGNAPINTPNGIANLPLDNSSLINTYGGNDSNSNSGILKYVRFEFGGAKDYSGISSNLITLAGVGKNTIIENIQTSYSLDDSFQIYGGNVNLKNIVSFRANDDDFDITQGAQCLIENSIAIRYPYNSDVLRSRCLEIESFDKREAYDPNRLNTTVKLKNVTLLNNDNKSSGLVKEAISLKRDASLEISNVLVAGFASFIAFEDYFFNDENYKKIKIDNSIIDSCDNLFSDETLKFNFDVAEVIENMNNWFIQSKNSNKITNINYSNLFINNDIKNNPDFRLK